MEYIITNNENLLIINDSNNQIFGISNDNCWYKWDYNHNGQTVYYEDSSGYINKL